MGLLFVALTGGGAHGEAAKKKRPKAEKPAAAECQRDEECTLVSDGCCGCNEGGKQRAIPRSARDGYEKRRQAMCRKSVCPAMMSDDATCEQRAVCKEGTCALGQ